MFLSVPIQFSFRRAVTWAALHVSRINTKSAIFPLTLTLNQHLQFASLIFNLIMERSKKKTMLDTATAPESLPDIASTHPGTLLAKASV